MGANGNLKGVKNRSCAKKCRLWFGPIIYYIFSLPAPFKISFFDTSKQLKCKSFFDTPRMPPGGCKMAPPRLKMARLGSPGLPKGAKGASSASQNAPKNRPRISTLSRTASKGAPAVSRVSSPLPKYCHFGRSIVPSRCQRQ